MARELRARRRRSRRRSRATSTSISTSAFTVGRAARARVGGAAAALRRCATTSTPSSPARAATAPSRASPSATSRTRARWSASTPASSRSASGRCCRSTGRCSRTRRWPPASSGGCSPRVAYQESQWDPFATSETGVRGLMQTHRGDRAPPRRRRPARPAAGDARRRALPRAISRRSCPDASRSPTARGSRSPRSTSALGHLEDARILAQKQKLNPDLWADVQEGAAAAGAARVLRAGAHRLRARRHAGGVRRQGARVLRRAARARGSSRLQPRLRHRRSRRSRDAPLTAGADGRASAPASRKMRRMLSMR